jgi:hypothetical protein
LAADGAPANVTTGLRLAAPLLEDFVHLARRMRADEIAQFIAIAGLTEYHADTAARAFANIRGPAYVLVDAAGYPVLAGGFEPLRPGVFEGWHVGTDAGWAEHGRSFVRVCRRLLTQILAGDAHRVQTVALASRTHAHRYYAALGMRCEGVLAKHFTDGQDGHLFARVSP